MSNKDKPPSMKFGNCSNVTFRNNRGIFAEFEDSENVEISHNLVNPDTQLVRGTRVKNAFVHSNQQRPALALDTFLSEASGHFHELTAEQQEEFRNAIAALKGSDEPAKSGALTWFYDLSVAIPGSVIATLLTQFFGR